MEITAVRITWKGFNSSHHYKNVSNVSTITNTFETNFVKKKKRNSATEHVKKNQIEMLELKILNSMDWFNSGMKRTEGKASELAE